MITNGCPHGLNDANQCGECALDLRYSVGDWERGYAKGYERALQQLVELVEGHGPPGAVVVVRRLADKLIREVLHDR